MSGPAPAKNRLADLIPWTGSDPLDVGNWGQLPQQTTSNSPFSPSWTNWQCASMSRATNAWASARANQIPVDDGSIESDRDANEWRQMSALGMWWTGSQGGSCFTKSGPILNRE